VRASVWLRACCSELTRVCVSGWLCLRLLRWLHADAQACRRGVVKARYCFLFSDLFIYTRRSGKDTYDYKHSLHVRRVKPLTELPPSDHEAGGRKHSLHRSVCVLSCVCVCVGVGVGVGVCLVCVCVCACVCACSACAHVVARMSMQHRSALFVFWRDYCPSCLLSECASSLTSTVLIHILHPAHAYTFMNISSTFALQLEPDPAAVRLQDLCR
jgi:hypothetical protein